LRFAVHRPASAAICPRFHGGPRRDISCRIHVSVAGVTAGHAAEESLAALLGEPRRPAPAGPSPGLLLDAQVPDEPGIRTVPQQDLLLLTGWFKTIPTHTNILAKILVDVPR